LRYREYRENREHRDNKKDFCSLCIPSCLGFLCIFY
jgi:hypothetical protein